MENLSTVLKRRRRELGLTLAQIADIMGVAEATVQRWESGNIKSVRHEKIAKLADLLQVSPASLMGWEATDTDSALPFPEPAVTDDVVTFYPIGTVAAGYGEIAYEDYGNDPVDIPRHYLGGRPQSDYFVLTVHGSSMYPGFLDGDKVLVLKQATLNKSGDIGVILYDGDSATLKKVEYADGEDWMTLIPTNPEYPPKTITGADLEQCRVLGIPRLLIREIR